MLVLVLVLVLLLICFNMSNQRSSRCFLSGDLEEIETSFNRFRVCLNDL